MSFALRNAAIARADAEIVRALGTDCNIKVDSISALVNSKARYPQAYPLLLGFLDRSDFPLRIREMLVRALTSKDAREAAFSRLLGHLEQSVSNECIYRECIGLDSYQFALTNALAVMASRKDRGILKNLARDERYGEARSILISAMRQWVDNEVDPIVVSAISSGSVSVRYQGIQVAGSRRIAGVVPLLDEAMSDSREAIREVARKALARILRPKKAAT